eukprot:TRINITY_DN4048_c0_g2_i2.p1 TRINITY_DN4048_c0_g2~~TRINITY_DN4048_c0_g2_i2.p1  ORF type:complete len:613 (-),score=127.29 TRINITY_DN4048_c0_g2_i2:38-1798(-)
MEVASDDEVLWTNRGLPQRSAKANAGAYNGNGISGTSSSRLNRSSDGSKASSDQISNKSSDSKSSTSSSKSKSNKTSSKSSSQSSKTEKKKSSQGKGASKKQVPKKRKKTDDSDTNSDQESLTSNSSSSISFPAAKRPKTASAPAKKSGAAKKGGEKTPQKKKESANSDANGAQKGDKKPKIKSPLPRLPKGQEPRGYERIDRNIYPCRPKHKWSKDDVIVCECKLKPDQTEGCTVGCLNRVLLVECVGEYCPCGEKCANRRFQLMQYAPIRPVEAGGKGWGIVATARIPKGTFVIEYVGEVIDSEELEDRAETYINDKHFYFLTLDANECIDARRKGNWARFINHSCDPNCQTQKWMVNGEVRIGIFTMRDVLEGEELTFDYQFERFGSKKQRCLCGSANCCQYIGGKIEKPGPQPDAGEKIKTKLTRPQIHTQYLLEEQNLNKVTEPFKVAYQPLFTPAGIKRASENPKRKRQSSASVDSSDSEDDFEPLPGQHRSDWAAYGTVPVFLRRNAERVRHARLASFQHMVYQAMVTLKAERDGELLQRKERSRQRRRENNQQLWNSVLLDPRKLRKLKDSGTFVLEN